MVHDQPERFRRFDIEESLRTEFEMSLSGRIERQMKLAHHPIVPAHYFTKPSTECLKLFRDGYFIGTVMMSHSIAEAIWRLVLERNSLPQDSGRHTEVPVLVQKEAISDACGQSLLSIYGRYRNDIHHMSQKIATIDFEKMALDSVNDLTVIEKDVFGFEVVKGKLKPHRPIYWDLNDGGQATVFLRLE